MAARLMAVFTQSDELRGAEFTGVNLSGARFTESYLTGAVMRGVDVGGLDIDSPWLAEGPLWVNGVDVSPLVEAELSRRFPGRAGRLSGDPAGLRAAWAALEDAWGAALARVAALPDGTVDASAGGEWSFAQTLRHLVMATDLWLGSTVLGLEQPFHPLGLPNANASEDGLDLSVFTTVVPSYAEVLTARAGRVVLVRDFIAGVTPEELAEPRANPWAPDRSVTTLSCLHVILAEEWEHLRYALRDLDAIAGGPANE